jgi:hypothetical protein
MGCVARLAAVLDRLANPFRVRPTTPPIHLTFRWRCGACGEASTFGYDESLPSYRVKCMACGRLNRVDVPPSVPHV